MNKLEILPIKNFRDHAGSVGVSSKLLALFHHDPERTEEQIDERDRTSCEPGRFGDLEAFFARQGMEVELFQGAPE